MATAKHEQFAISHGKKKEAKCRKLEVLALKHTHLPLHAFYEGNRNLIS